MASLQTFVLLLAFSLTFLQLSSASPLSGKRVSNGTNGTNTVNSIPTPSLPLSGEATELPLPSQNLTLKRVAIGHGVQNYTCASADSKPASIGALATLFDATVLAYTSPSVLHMLPAITVMQPLTNALVPNNPLSFPMMPMMHPKIDCMPIIGGHYFTANGTPVFDFTTVREILFAKKIADIPSPAGAPEGPTGAGAVDWLALTDDGKGGSVGLSEVYRVETAGGGPGVSCQGRRDGVVFSVEYSAEYWFYG